jgi:Kdo2-lipid IVA lauroyltransferase/acyltransferase
MAERRASLTDYAEGAGAVALYAFFRLLPLDWASGLGGFVARMVGPHLGVSKRARENLHLAMPELNDEAIEKIVRGMWDNLGRVCAEYPHLRQFRAFDEYGRIERDDRANILGAHAADKRYIFFSAHYGNWEIAIRTATEAGFAVTAVYRAANNPIVDRLITWARGADGGELVPKGAIAAYKAFGALRAGRELCMLVDQKMNDGIAVPFFGRDAMTAPALARLALRFNCAVVPVRVDRTTGAHFRITAEPPLDLPRSGNEAADTLALMTQVNRVIERWIRERPEQWFWLHRRWPDV